MVVIGVIGTGYWGKNHVRTFCTLKEEGLIDKVIVCDSDESRAIEIGEEFGCEYATDPQELASLGVSMVTIATPTPSHASLAIMMMEMGLDVLVEKPLAMNTKEAKRVIMCAEKTGRLLLVGHVFRHHSGVRKAAELVKNGIHPTTIMTGFRIALKDAVKFVKSALLVPVERIGDEAIISAAKTSMASKLLNADEDFWSKLAVDAVRSVKT